MAELKGFVAYFVFSSGAGELVTGSGFRDRATATASDEIALSFVRDALGSLEIAPASRYWSRFTLEASIRSELPWRPDQRRPERSRDADVDDLLLNASVVHNETWVASPRRRASPTDTTMI